MPSVFIKTYGCQMNERDSETVAAQFLARGYALAASEATADVVLLNTCSVRDAAEAKAAGKMAALGAMVRRRRPGVVLGYLGCMAQSRGDALLKGVPGVRLVLGTQKFHRAAEYVDEILSGTRQQICDVGEEPGSEAHIREHILDFAAPVRPVKAFVSIMQGCNQHCTFCIVPQTRGEERSRSIQDIVNECRGLAARGVREVTLLGQIVTSYGMRSIAPREGASPFVQLLDAVSTIEGIDRIRFTSPHPKGYGDDLVAAYARLPKVCSSAHIPVQSGSDRVLKLMHRGYTRERYLEIVRKLRAVRPDIGVSTDLIVGFPGETDADFEATLDLVREAAFDNAFVFKYSARQNTPAAAMPGALPQDEIEARHARLLHEVNDGIARRLQSLVGQQLEVLVEGPSRKNPSRLEGRTSCHRIVVFEGAPRHVGQLMKLRITRASAVTLYGDPAVLNPE